MSSKRKLGRSLGLLLLGIILGAGGMLGFLSILPKPTIPLVGTVRLDTASYETLYFNNALYLVQPTVGETIYLNFRDDVSRNSVINKTVLLRGQIKTVDVGDGQRVTALDVLSVEPQP